MWRHLKVFMKRAILVVLSAAGGLCCALAADTNVSSVIQLNHDQVAAVFAKGGPLFVTNNFKIQAGHREGPGTVEMHERDTDIFYVLDGTATMITGGTTVEPRTVSAGEIRGKAITGGETRHLAKGDVLVIPTGVPHWVTESAGPFLYFVVKVSQ
jgi:mannose-6-phosphate isomerase-like protein (cupin superfamily)